MIKIGDVVRIKGFLNPDFKAHDLWALVVGGESRSYFQNIVLKGRIDTNSRSINVMQSFATAYPSEALQEVAPEDEWPDEVCVEVVRRALIGGET